MMRKYKFNIIPIEFVSRLLVRLHHKMEEKAIWRNGLYFQSNNLMIFLNFVLNKNIVEIFVRGSKNKKIVENIIKDIKDEINKKEVLTCAIS